MWWCRAEHPACVNKPLTALAAAVLWLHRLWLILVSGILIPHWLNHTALLAAHIDTVKSSYFLQVVKQKRKQMQLSMNQ